MIVVMIRTRKAGSVTMISYLSNSFMYTKVANLILWFYADVRYGLVFSVIFVCKLFMYILLFMLAFQFFLNSTFNIIFQTFLFEPGIYKQ